MTLLLADACFDHDLLRALLHHRPNLDIVTAQSLAMDSADDRELREWAARHDRVILTHDLNTLAGFAYERVQAGMPMLGVIEVRLGGAWSRIIDDLLLLITCATTDELQNRVHFVPLR